MLRSYWVVKNTIAFDNADNDINEWATETAVIDGYVKIMRIKDEKVERFSTLEDKTYYNGE